MRSVAAASDLPIIVYHRGNAQFTAAAAIAVSNPFRGRLQGRRRRSRPARAHRPRGARCLEGRAKHFQFFNGMPTAEMSSRPTARSASPCTRRRCSASRPRSRSRSTTLSPGNDALTALLREFFPPLVRLRDTGRATRSRSSRPASRCAGSSRAGAPTADRSDADDVDELQRSSPPDGPDRRCVHRARCDRRPIRITDVASPPWRSPTRRC